MSPLYNSANFPEDTSTHSNSSLTSLGSLAIVQNENDCSTKPLQECHSACKWCPTEKACCALAYPNCEPFVLFKGLMGGIGNRLWMYLSSVGLAKKNGCALVLPNSSFSMIAEIFQVNEDEVNVTLVSNGYSKAQFGEYKEPNYFTYTPLNSTKNTVIKGYLQNHQYIADTPDELADSIHLDFKLSILEEACQLQNSMAYCQDNATDLPVVTAWVGLHVRRWPDKRRIEPEPSPEEIVPFVNSVLEDCMRKQGGSQKNATCRNSDGTSMTLSSCCALIFSNDPDWTRSNLGTIQCAQFVENDFLADPLLSNHGSKRNNGWASNYGRDMAALSLCDYLVITVGTFGYWAGIFHGKQEHKANDAQVYSYIGSMASVHHDEPSWWKSWGKK